MTDKNKKELQKQDQGLTLWDPFEDFFGLRNNITSLFDNFISARDKGLLSKESYNWQPRVDVKETDTELVVSASIPGVDKDGIDVNVEDGVLTIKGERKEEKEEKAKGYIRKEQSYGSFYRAFTLPKNTNPDAIKANYKNGVLELKIPKVKEEKPAGKKIAIE